MLQLVWLVNLCRFGYLLVRQWGRDLPISHRFLGSHLVGSYFSMCLDPNIYISIHVLHESSLGRLILLVVPIQTMSL